MPSSEEPASGNDIVILGGGVCGLYAALEVLSAGEAVTVLEREPYPGGLAAGVEHGGNFYDLGVHMLHGFDREILTRIRQLMGTASIPVELNAKIRWVGRDFRYPLQFRDMVNGIPPVTLARCIAGLLGSELKKRIKHTDPVDAEAALIQLYGRPLYEFFFERFTERYWGIPPAQLSASFVKTKMPRLTVRDTVMSILHKSGLKQKDDFAVASALLNETLYYSPTGAEGMPRALVEHIRKMGGEVLLGCTFKRLRIDPAGGACRVSYQERISGEVHERRATHCISTIPLPQLVRALRPGVPDAVLCAAGELNYKPIVVYGLLVNKPKALDALYVYYRDRCFHRIGEPKNAGLKVAPADHTVLLVEMTCDIGDDKWSGARHFQQHLLNELAEEGVCTPEQVVERHVLQCAEGYPIFSLGFETQLEIVRNHLEGISNLYSTGRQGGFCYPNIHGSMRLGADAAQEILRGASRSHSNGGTVAEEPLLRSHGPASVK